MEKDLELDLDIKYVKSFVDKCSFIRKKMLNITIDKNKKLFSRICFIIFQFRNIFDNGLWL